MLSAPAPLVPDHKLDEFNSGVKSLDDWLRQRALRNQASGASRTFVVCQVSHVVAYYALAAGGVTLSAAPGRFRRNMPDPIPIVLLGRLAVDVAHQRKGIARSLMRDAFHRVLQAASFLGIRGIVVHAISEEAKEFYRRVGFDVSPLHPMTLMLGLSEIQAQVQGQ